MSDYKTLRQAYNDGWVDATPRHVGGEELNLKDHNLVRGAEYLLTEEELNAQNRILIDRTPTRVLSVRGCNMPIYSVSQTVPRDNLPDYAKQLRAKIRTLHEEGRCVCKLLKNYQRFAVRCQTFEDTRDIVVAFVGRCSCGLYHTIDRVIQDELGTVEHWKERCRQVIGEPTAKIVQYFQYRDETKEHDLWPISRTKFQPKVSDKDIDALFFAEERQADEKRMSEEYFQETGFLLPRMR